MPTPTPGLWKCANGEIVEVVGRAKAGAYPWLASTFFGQGAVAYDHCGRHQLTNDWNLVEPYREAAKIPAVVYGYRDPLGNKYASLERNYIGFTPIGSARVEIIEGVFAEPETKGASS